MPQREAIGLALGLAPSFALGALLFGMVARSAAEGSLDRNGLVGIRTRATRSSDEAWRAGHAAALPSMRVAGRVSLGSAVVLPGVALAGVGPGVVGAVAGAAAAVLIGVLLLASRRADRAARAVARLQG